MLWITLLAQGQVSIPHQSNDAHQCWWTHERISFVTRERRDGVESTSGHLHMSIDWIRYSGAVCNIGMKIVGQNNTIVRLEYTGLFEHVNRFNVKSHFLMTNWRWKQYLPLRDTYTIISIHRIHFHDTHIPENNSTWVSHIISKWILEYTCASNLAHH